MRSYSGPYFRQSDQNNSEYGHFLRSGNYYFDSQRPIVIHTRYPIVYKAESNTELPAQISFISGEKILRIQQSWTKYLAQSKEMQ